MRLGLYIFASTTLIMIIGGLVYLINSDSFAIEFMEGFKITLPIAIWVILPMIVFLILTIFHMFVYGFKNFFILKKWQKDATTLEDALYWSLLNEPQKKRYMIKDLENFAIILDKASLSIDDNIDGLSPKLSSVLHLTLKIKNGEYIDLKEHKLSGILKDGNPILIQNRLNRLKSDEAFVEDVMKSPKKYSKTVQVEALDIFSQRADFDDAIKYIDIFESKHFFAILDRVTLKNSLGLSSEILTQFVYTLKLECKEFIKIVLITKRYFKPEENLKLFKDYQSENEKAQNAYIYLLFEYELLDQVSAYLSEHELSEFLKFRALNELKQNNSIYKLEDIIDIHSVCNETKLH
ncbi:MAG: hypothetical protein QM493_10245 [Sulfurovum sp.]